MNSHCTGATAKNWLPHCLSFFIFKKNWSMSHQVLTQLFLSGDMNPLLL